VTSTRAASGDRVSAMPPFMPALAVPRAGAQPSLPTRDAVSELLSRSVGERFSG
jgi:hypothetical protein